MRDVGTYAHRLLVAAMCAAWGASSAVAQIPYQLHSEGYGPVRVGMTVAQATRALGVALVPPEGSEPIDNCETVQPARGHRGVTFLVQQGLISRASLTVAGITTPKGVTVGDRATKVKSLYGPQLKTETGDYAEYLTYWVSPTRGVRFEVDEGRVTTIHGGEAIELIEGCL